MVNWELHEGETVEKFAAALLLLTNPSGNRITPSRGDRGIDIIVDTPDGADIYQVKRYTRPLTTAQQREVKASWRRFETTILPTRKVRSWTLVVPLDPSNERREWLMAFGDDHPSLSIGWLGRTQLDVLASDNPKLVDYFFEAGRERTIELMTRAISIGSDLPPGPVGDNLLAVIAERHDLLIESLNDVDPYYRCEREVRHGRVPVDHDAIQVSDTRGAAWVKYEQVTPDRYSILRWFPLCAESHWLRPINFTLTLQGTEDDGHSEALRNFALYGAPIDGIPGEVTSSAGPDGGRVPEGPALFSIFAAPLDPDSHPDIELRIFDPDSGSSTLLPLEHVSLSSGLVTNPGFRLAADDPSGYLTVEILAGIADEPQRLSVIRHDLDGLTPHKVMAAVRACAAMKPGSHGVIAQRDAGPELTGRWVFDDSEGVRRAAMLGKELLEACRALVEIQAHTFSKIRLPSSDTPARWVDYILSLASLIRGEVDEVGPWPGAVTITVDGQRNQFDSDQIVDVLFDALLTVDTTREVVETDVPVRIRVDRARVVQAERDKLLTVTPLAPGGPTVRYLRVQDDDWVRHRVQVRPVLADQG